MCYILLYLIWNKNETPKIASTFLYKFQGQSEKKNIINMLNFIIRI